MPDAHQINDYLLDIQFDAFERLGAFLNNTPDAISADLVRQMQDEIGCDAKYSYTLLLAAYCGLDISANAMHKDMFHLIFEPALHLLDAHKYQKNNYYRHIRFDDVRCRQWQLCKKEYKAFEAFVCNDINVSPQGLQIPSVGVFAQPFTYPAVLEDGRIWMTVTPNEIETMEEPVANAAGKVLAYGLGLGYFPYMVSLKNNVHNVTVVEKDPAIIDIFKKHLLPQFPEKDKITLVNDDAFHYAATAMPTENFDSVFTDLWHDVSDGMPLYLKMKTFEKLSPNAKFDYWIEKSIKFYLPE